MAGIILILTRLECQPRNNAAFSKQSPNAVDGLLCLQQCLLLSVFHKNNHSLPGASTITIKPSRGPAASSSDCLDTPPPPLQALVAGNMQRKVIDDSSYYASIQSQRKRGTRHPGLHSLLPWFPKGSGIYCACLAYFVLPLSFLFFSSCLPHPPLSLRI